MLDLNLNSGLSAAVGVAAGYGVRWFQTSAAMAKIKAAVAALRGKV